MNRVIDGVDLDGLEYRSVKDNDGNYSGFQWDPENAHAEDGSLKPGYSEKAILFSQTDKTFNIDGFDESKQRYPSMNIGTAQATVLSSVTVNLPFFGVDIKVPFSQSFDASTLPSDVNNYDAIASGLYIGKFGKHKLSVPGGYPAINLYTLTGSRSLPATNGGTVDGANIHYAGGGDYTGTVWKKTKYNFTLGGLTREIKMADQRNIYGGISEGCPIISTHSWGSFIKLFNSSDTQIQVIIQQRQYTGGDTHIPAENPDVQKFNSYKKAEEIHRIFMKQFGNE